MQSGLARFLECPLDVWCVLLALWCVVLKKETEAVVLSCCVVLCYVVRCQGSTTLGCYSWILREEDRD